MVINGIDVVALGEAVEMVTQNPSLGSFTFRTSSDWVQGAKTLITIDKYRGDLGLDERPPIVIVADEPGSLAGSDEGANPIELLLSSISACLTVGFIYTAAGRGIVLHKMQLKLEADIDLQGFLGTDATVRRGVQTIRIRCEIASDASDEVLEQLKVDVLRDSPLLNTITQPAAWDLEMVRVKIGPEKQDGNNTTAGSS